MATVGGMQREPENIRISEATERSVQRLADSVGQTLDDIIYDRALRAAESVVSAPLRSFGLTRDIPIDDVALDVDDFGVLAALGSETRMPCPALVIDPAEAPIPLLPAYDFIGDQRWRVASLRADLLDWMDTQSAKVSIPWPQARNRFIGGLEPFMRARVEGVQWARDQRDETLRASLFGHIGIPGGNTAPPGGGQWWTIETRLSGLNIYHAGTHAARQPPNFAGGVTAAKPRLKVFLPMGTVHIGADSLPNGHHDWDPSSITVPSPTPQFKTKRF